MSESEKKQQRIYNFFNAGTKPKFLFLPYTKHTKKKKKKKNTEKELFKEKWAWRIEQKTKRWLFNCCRYGD